VVRTQIAPNHFKAVTKGRALFESEGLTGVDNVSCATCHGGAQWTRSLVDFTAPPSANLAHGNEEVVGAELTKTASQPGDAPHTGVLVDVGTFVGFDPATKTGRVNEARPNPADISQRLTALGAKGFNIPSLLGVGNTRPYFHNGMAATLEEVLNGQFDGKGTGSLKQVHLIPNSADRAAVVEFLKSIDATTATFP
jgi:cytochrome c peroxidase